MNRFLQRQHLCLSTEINDFINYRNHQPTHKAHAASPTTTTIIYLHTKAYSSTPSVRGTTPHRNRNRYAHVHMYTCMGVYAVMSLKEGRLENILR